MTTSLRKATNNYESWTFQQHSELHYVTKAGNNLVMCTKIRQDLFLFFLLRNRVAGVNHSQDYLSPFQKKFKS